MKSYTPQPQMKLKSTRSSTQMGRTSFASIMLETGAGAGVKKWLWELAQGLGFRAENLGFRG